MKKIGIFIIFMTFGWQHWVFAQSITVYYDWMTDFPVAEMVKHGQSREMILAMNKHTRPRKVFCLSDAKNDIGYRKS